MSHPFGDLLSCYLHRKHGLSQSRLAAGILQDPSTITKMCKGRRLTGAQARERVLAIADWLRTQTAIETVEEANALLAAAGMAPLRLGEPGEYTLLLQLQPQTLPSPTSLVRASAPMARRTNLPAVLTSFIGRIDELADVAQSVATHRLVTLTGAGGVGKTRLATETGIQLVQGDAFSDGVWLVELADLSRSTLVAQALVRCFKLPEQMGQTPVELLQDYLADKQLLLILDNCEHLVEACAGIVEQLLRRCWRLHVLATSREELCIPGEAIYPVPPLALPDPLEHDPDRVLASAAAQLFVERSGAGQRKQHTYREDAATIARICRQLDGIPLALELAAPLTRSMPLSEIAVQLGNQMGILTNTYRTAIPRHQTMHHALVWSYRLLAPAEQRLLDRVAVFAGGWTLDAARACCDGIPAADLLPSLQQLVAKSLVLEEDLSGQRRYRLLEPVRQFAHAQLVASGEQDEIRRRHAAYFLALVEAAQPVWERPEGQAWLDRLEADIDNLRAVFAWSSTPQGDGEIGAHQLAALVRFSLDRMHMSEARAWLARLLERRYELTPSIRIEVLEGAAWNATLQRDYGTAIALFEEGAALGRDVGDKVALARALSGRGFVAQSQGNYEEAHRLHQESFALSRQSGDSWGMMNALQYLGDVALDQGSFAQAEGSFEKALVLAEELGTSEGIAWTLRRQGQLALAQNEPARAIQLCQKSLALFRSLKIRGGIGWALLDLARARHAQGDAGKAMAFYAECLEVSRELGDPLLVAQSMVGLAGVAGTSGQLERAAFLFGNVQTLAESLGVPMPSVMRAEYDGDVAAASAQAEVAVWAAAWAEGQAMTLEHAIAYALGTNPESSAE